MKMQLLKAGTFTAILTIITAPAGVQAGFLDNIVNKAKQAVEDSVRETSSKVLGNNEEEKVKSQEQQQTTSKPQYDPRLIADVQRELNRVGFNVGRVDGAYGPGTAAAIRKFQHEHSLNESGVPSQQLLAMLRSQPARANSNLASNSFTGEQQAGVTIPTAKSEDITPLNNKVTNDGGSSEISSDKAKTAHGISADLFPDCMTYFMVWAQQGREFDTQVPTYMPDLQPGHSKQYLRKSFLDERFLPYFGKPFGKFTDAEIDLFQTHFEQCMDTVWRQKQRERNTHKMSRQEWAEFSRPWQEGHQWLRDNFYFRNRNISFKQEGIHPQPLLQQRANYRGRQQALLAVADDKQTVPELPPTAESLRDIQQRQTNTSFAYMYKSEYDTHQQLLQKNQQRLASEVIDLLIAEVNALPSGRKGIQAAIGLRRNAEREIQALVDSGQWNRFMRSFDHAYQKIAHSELPGFVAELNGLSASEAGIKSAYALMDQWFDSVSYYPTNAVEYQQAVNTRVTAMRETMRVYACNQKLQTVGMLESKDATVLGYNGPETVGQFLCNLDGARYKLVSYKKGGILSGEDVLTLETNRGVHVQVELITAEVQAGKEMLVGRSVKKATSSKDLSIDQWQDFYGELVGKHRSSINF